VCVSMCVIEEENRIEIEKSGREKSGKCRVEKDREIVDE
jgi:hypothetical protein